MTNWAGAAGWLVVGAVGHAALWVMLFNRLHALPLPWKLQKVADKLQKLVIVALPVYWLARLWAADFLWPAGRDVPAGEQYYWGLCAAALLLAIVGWTQRQLAQPGRTLSTVRVLAYEDVAAQCAEPVRVGRRARLLHWLPGNQAAHLETTAKTLYLPRLPEPLAGFRIAHLTDLHYCGQIGPTYFREVVVRTNRLEPDLVVITGDLVDKAPCLDWLDDTLGRLRARHGVFFVLGNHDLRLPDCRVLRRRLELLGLIDLGGKLVRLSLPDQPARGHPAPCDDLRSKLPNLSLPGSIDAEGGGAYRVEILLAGNERPWFRGLPDVPDRDPVLEDGRVLRVLLAHTPDQIGWARRNEFDLMLAGHNHGGQIRLPALGPIVTPSRYGVKYAAGIFDEAPTLLHVSRGVSGLEPIRLGCAPELALLTLQPFARRQSAAAELAPPVRALALG